MTLAEGIDTKWVEEKERLISVATFLKG